MSLLLLLQNLKYFPFFLTVLSETVTTWQLSCLAVELREGNIKIPRKRGSLSVSPLRSHQFSYKQRLTQRQSRVYTNIHQAPAKSWAGGWQSCSPHHNTTHGNILSAFTAFRSTIGAGGWGEEAEAVSKIYCQHLRPRNIPRSRWDEVACRYEGVHRECCKRYWYTYTVYSTHNVSEILERTTDGWRLEIILRITSSTCSISSWQLNLLMGGITFGTFGF